MISQTDLSAKAAYDTKGMSELGKGAKANDPKAIKAAATQFEGLFINMMLKSMRDATPQDGPLDSETTKMFTSMMDQQTSQALAKRGTGLADVLVRQMTANSGALAANGGDADMSQSSLAAALDLRKAKLAASEANGDAPISASKVGALGAAKRSEADEKADKADAINKLDKSGRRPGVSLSPHVREFREQLTKHAEQASLATGVPAKFMLGQAALESGWGKRVIKGSHGELSNNLFGIKAGPDWKGKTVSAVTTEYVHGVPQTRLEKFRAYDSYADSFTDYANMIVNNKRYAGVMASAGDASSFAVALQRAGYATDPNYAAKLTRIIQHSLYG